MKRRVLFITHSFPPSNAPAAQRVFFFAKYLESSGEIVPEVVTPEVAVTKAGTSDWDAVHGCGFKVHKTSYLIKPGSGTGAAKSPGAQKSTGRRGIARLMVPDRGIIWYPTAVSYCKKLLKTNDYAAVISSSPLFGDHLIARKIAKSHGIKWIADFRDFHYIENHEKNSSGLFKYMQRRIEESVIRDATSLVFISERMRDEYVRRYPSASEKANVIFNGYDPPEYHEPLPTDSGPLRIFYSGSFYGGTRSPTPMLRALEHLLETKRATKEDFQILLAGNPNPETVELFDRHRLIEPCVRFLGQLPRTDVLKHYASSDVLWLIVGQSKSHRYGFPLKGFEYFGAQRPIVAFCPEDSDAEQFLEMAGRGRTFVGEANIEQVADHLLDLVRDKSTSRIPKSFKHIEAFTRDFQTRQMTNLILESH